MNGPEAYEQALRWLARRSYGERELAGRLRRNGASGEAADEAVARCRALGYLNDAAFAESRARHRFGQGHGPARVRAELLHLGIDPEIVESLLADRQRETDSVTMAARVLEKRFGPPVPLEFRERRRRYAFLARRGFDAEVIEAVLSGDG